MTPPACRRAPRRGRACSAGRSCPSSRRRSRGRRRAPRRRDRRRARAGPAHRSRPSRAWRRSAGPPDSRSTPPSRPRRRWRCEPLMTTCTGSGDCIAAPRTASGRPCAASMAGKTPAASERSSSSTPSTSSTSRWSISRAPCGARGHHLLGELQADAQRDEALLAPVVQVALDPAALLVGRGQDACARRAQLAARAVHACGETRVLVPDERVRPHRLDERASARGASLRGSSGARARPRPLDDRGGPLGRASPGSAAGHPVRGDPSGPRRPGGRRCPATGPSPRRRSPRGAPRRRARAGAGGRGRARCRTVYRRQRDEAGEEAERQERQRERERAGQPADARSSTCVGAAHRMAVGQQQQHGASRRPEHGRERPPHQRRRRPHPVREAPEHSSMSRIASAVAQRDDDVRHPRRRGLDERKAFAGHAATHVEEGAEDG